MCCIAANLDLNALACFDLMVEACQNLSCLSHGADPPYIKLHAQTHKHTKYYPKHAYGVSEQYNQYEDTAPWYRAGQGTGDAAVQWTLVSHFLILAYQSEVTSYSAICDILAYLGLDAFVDNTNLVYSAPGHTPFNEIVQNIQHNLDLWHGLLQSSGGTPSPKKCSWTPFYWQSDKYGTPMLTEPPEHMGI